jgi:hypothetical protein
MAMARLGRHLVETALCAVLAAGCDAPLRLAVPPGRPTAIALRVGFYRPSLGTWTVDGFSDSLREELAKYDVAVVPNDSLPENIAVVTLGDWTDRVGVGRSIDVALLNDGGLTEAGRVRIPDLSMTTLAVASEYVAVLIVRRLRTPSELQAPPRAANSE